MKNLTNPAGRLVSYNRQPRTLSPAAAASVVQSTVRWLRLKKTLSVLRAMSLMASARSKVGRIVKIVKLLLN